MSQDLEERLHLVEQSARRWKRLALGSWALLALLLLVCAGLAIRQVTVLREMAAREREAALVAEQRAQQEREAREQAEQRRQGQEEVNRLLQEIFRDLEPAEKKEGEEEKARKKAEKTSMMQMYQAHILLARHEWERRQGTRPAGKP